MIGFVGWLIGGGLNSPPEQTAAEVRRQIRVQELNRLQNLIQDNEKAKREGRIDDVKSREDLVGKEGELLLEQGVNPLSNANTYAKNTNKATTLMHFTPYSKTAITTKMAS